LTDIGLKKKTRQEISGGLSYVINKGVRGKIGGIDRGKKKKGKKEKIQKGPLSEKKRPQVRSQKGDPSLRDRFLTTKRGPDL